MSLVNSLLGGVALVGIGVHSLAGISASAATLDATNEACIVVGRIVCETPGPHTLDTSGSSAIRWRAGNVTFANAGTTLKVGLATVDSANGPPGRAVNVSDVISFDVSADFVGGGGGITSNNWRTSVPTTGSKTVQNGDIVAMAWQMTARGGSDSVIVTHCAASSTLVQTAVTTFAGGSYVAANMVPNAIIVFSDGTRGWFKGTEYFSAPVTRTYHSGSALNEYGQLFQFPTPMLIDGLWAAVQTTGDLELCIYSDPLGTPVLEGSSFTDVNWASIGSVRRLIDPIATPFLAPANQPFAVTMRPTTTTNVGLIGKTIGDAADRIADPGGLLAYGISRGAGGGPFANASSSLDHYQIGFVLGGMDDGSGGGGGGAGLFPGSNMRGGFQ